MVLIEYLFRIINPVKMLAKIGQVLSSTERALSSSQKGEVIAICSHLDSRQVHSGMTCGEHSGMTTWESMQG